MRLKIKNIGMLAIATFLMINMMSQQSFAIEDETINIVKYLGIMKGDEKGDMNLEDQVTRAELTKMLVAASSLKDEVTSNSYVSTFSDVSYKHWSAGYVKAALDAGWVTGYVNGSFKPNQAVKLEEAVTMILRVIGYDQSNLVGVYPNPQLNQYRLLKLDRGIDKEKGDYLTREDCAKLFVNLLETKTVKGSYYANDLGYELDADGHMVYDQLIETDLVGPIVVTGNAWALDLPFKSSQGTFYKDGGLVSQNQIQMNDVYYYNPLSKKVWSYSDKILGTITAIDPNVTSPKTITVSGRTVNVSTLLATQKIKQNGKYVVGDKVALLLGSDKTVVDIIGLDQADGFRYGVVTSTEVTTEPKADGTRQIVKKLTLAEADGSMNTYVYDEASTFTVGSVVEVAFIGGSVKVKNAQLNIASGLFDMSKMTLGGYPMAKDVKIMDVNNQGGHTIIYPSRVDQVILSTSSIVSVFYNEKLEIDTIILRNATGDLYDYGYLETIKDNYTTIQNKDGSISEVLTSKTYTFHLNGVERSMTKEPDQWNASTGGIYVNYDSDGMISGIVNIGTLSVQGITQTMVQSNGRTYTLADDVEVYFYEKGKYTQLNTSVVADLEKYDFTAYYDIGRNVGGLVRVIIARDR